MPDLVSSSDEDSDSEDPAPYNMRPRKSQPQNTHRCKECDYSCPTSRGLKMHVTKTHKKKTHVGADEQPHSPRASKTEGTQNGPGGITHSPDVPFEHLQHQPQASPKDRTVGPVRPRLLLPAAGDRVVWKELNTKMEAKLVYELGPSWEKLPLSEMSDRLNDVVYEALAEEVGVAQPTTKPTQSGKRQSRRRDRMAKLRRLKRSLRKQWVAAKANQSTTEEEVKKLRSLWNKAVRVHNRLRVLEKDDASKETQAKQNKEFASDPHRFAKNLFTPRTEGKPAFSADEATTFFEKTYTDDDRAHKYEMPPELQQQRPPLPEYLFDVEVPSYEDMVSQLNRKKNSSSPGRSALPYLVWKRLPFLRERLYELFKRAWHERDVPTSWQVATVILFAKTDDTSKPELMRPIALTNCDGKLFFTLVQVKLTEYMVNNNFIDRTVQKAFMSGVSGCIEHNQMLWEALKAAFQQRLSICVTWLDLRNAYGSVRHNLIQFALQYYHFPPMIAQLIFAYYDGLVATVSANGWSTPLFNYGIGVFQGCTMSTILFNIVFNLLFEWLKRCDVPRFEITDGVSIREPFFADDIAFVTRRRSDNQDLLNETGGFLKWTDCMEAKPPKCRSLAYRQFRGRADHQPLQPYEDLTYSAYDPKLTIVGDPITFIGRADEISGPQHLCVAQGRCAKKGD